MIQSNFLQSFLKSDINKTSSQVVQLKQGQIFQGKIVKFHPNNIALVNLGGIKLHAKLEAPLSAQMNYFFQVQKNEQVVELKVLERNNAYQGKLPEGVLGQIGVGASKVDQQLFHSFVREQLPFLKENLVQGSEWLKEIPKGMSKEDAIKVIHHMVERNLPFTKNVFNSLIALQDKDSLGAKLSTLQTMIKDNTYKSSVVVQLKDTVDSILGRMSETKNKEILFSLMDRVLSNNDQQSKSLLHKLGVLPTAFSVTDLEAALKSFLKSEFPAVFEKQLTNKEALNFITKQANHELQDKLLTSLNKEFTMNTLNEQLKSLFTFNRDTEKTPFIMNNKLFFNDEINQLQQISNDIQLASSKVDFRKGNDVYRFLKSSLALLGLDFEHNLANIDRFPESELRSLKPLLLKGLQEPLPYQMKELFEQILSRVTGQQIVSSQQNGPFQTLLMQIPIQFGELYTDLTIQWQGKKKKDGKIDSDFCRIIFYLELEKMKETVIDVQVQNRIININLVNENEAIKQWIPMLQPLLKEKLLEKGYQLSAIKMEVGQEKKQHEVKNKELRSFSFTGVDFKV